LTTPNITKINFRKNTNTKHTDNIPNQKRSALSTAPSSNTNDYNIYYSGMNIKTTSSFVQLAIDSVKRWSKQIAFKFSPSKSKTILFTHKKTINTPEIKIQGTIVLNTNNIRLLNLIFDRQLKWIEHLKKLKPYTTKTIKTEKHFLLDY